MAAEPSGRLGADTLGEARVERVRAFFGLRLPEEHREKLGRYLAACAALAPEFRWTPAENLHLTVRFLGHVERAQAEGIAERVEAANPAALQLDVAEKPDR